MQRFNQNRKIAGMFSPVFAITTSQTGKLVLLFLLTTQQETWHRVSDIHHGESGKPPKLSSCHYSFPSKTSWELRNACSETQQDRINISAFPLLLTCASGRKWKIHLRCAKTQLKLAHTPQIAKSFLSMASSKTINSSLFKPHW